jgi:hypothetical protein
MAKRGIMRHAENAPETGFIGLCHVPDSDSAISTAVPFVSFLCLRQGNQNVTFSNRI